MTSELNNEKKPLTMKKDRNRRKNRELVNLLDNKIAEEAAKKE